MESFTTQEPNDASLLQLTILVTEILQDTEILFQDIKILQDIRTVIHTLSV